MAVTDPNGDRATAMVNLLNNLPQGDPEIYISVLLFAGFTPVWLTNGGLPGFTQLVTMSPDGHPGPGGQGVRLRVPRKYGEPRRHRLREAARRDLRGHLPGHQCQQRSNALGMQETSSPSGPAYSIIFLSDGGPPSARKTGHRRPGDLDPLARLRVSRLPPQHRSSLRTHRAADVICNPDSDSGCEQILRPTSPNAGMATLGGGQFRDFENHEPINFLASTSGPRSATTSSTG